MSEGIIGAGVRIVYHTKSRSDYGIMFIDIIGVEVRISIPCAIT